MNRKERKKRKRVIGKDGVYKFIKRPSPCARKYEYEKDREEVEREWSEKMRTKEKVKEAIEKEGIYNFIRRPWSFGCKYGHGEEEEEVEREWNRGVEEDRKVKLMSIGKCKRVYEDQAADELKEGIKSFLFGYVDIEAMICDDIEDGYLSYVILENGNFYLVRPICAEVKG